MVLQQNIIVKTLFSQSIFQFWCAEIGISLTLSFISCHFWHKENPFHWEWRYCWKVALTTDDGCWNGIGLVVMKCVYIYYTLHARENFNTKSISYSRNACHRVNDTVADYTYCSAVLSPAIKYIVSSTLFPIHCNTPT